MIARSERGNGEATEVRSQPPLSELDNIDGFHPGLRWRISRCTTV